MVEIQVPVGAGTITISYAGDPPVAYEAEGGVVEVGALYVDAFLAAVPGSSVVPPPLGQPAATEPVPEQGVKSAPGKK